MSARSIVASAARSAADVFEDRLAARADVEFPIDIPQVESHGIDADPQFAGDLLVEVSFHEQVKGGLFALGQIVIIARHGHRNLEMLHHLARDGAGHGCPPGKHVIQRF